jgi:copper chaperone
MKAVYKTNINCSGCVASVTPGLNKLDNVDEWKVDLEHPDRLLHVELDDDDTTAVENAVKEAGFTIEPT